MKRATRSLTAKSAGGGSRPACLSQEALTRQAPGTGERSDPPSLDPIARPLEGQALAKAVPEESVRHLRTLGEPLAVLSLLHLCERTRMLLVVDELSVNAYPTVTGALIYVGAPRYDTPLEPDLARLFEVAEAAGIVWLKFDLHGPVIEGLTVFGDQANAH